MKNLKKKVALLLAFVMVLSLVPSMGAFGNIVSGVSVQLQREGHAAGVLYGTGARPFFTHQGQQVAFSVSFANMFTADRDPTPGYLQIGGEYVPVPGFAVRINVTGNSRSEGDAGDYRGLHQASAANVAGLDAWDWTVDPGRSQLDASIATGTAGNTMQEFWFSGTSTQAGFALTINGIANVGHENNVLNVYVGYAERNADGEITSFAWVRVVDGQSLVRPGFDPDLGVTRGVNIARVGDAAAWGGHGALELPNIRISERNMGDLWGGDQFYITLSAPSNFLWAGLPSVSGDLDPTIFPTVTTSGINTDTVRVPVRLLGRDIASLDPQSFVLSNLRLIHRDPTNPPDTAVVNIGVSISPINSAANPFPAGVTYRANTATLAMHHFNGLLGLSANVYAGTFRAHGVSVGTVGNIPALVSGRSGVDARTITITEDAVGSLFRGVPITIDVNHPGVRILSATTYAFRAGQTGIANEGRLRPEARREAVNDPTITDPNFIFLPRGLSFTLTEEQMPSADHRMEIEVILELELDPNFAGHGFSNSIEANVTVFAFGQPQDGGRRVTIGTVSDPVFFSPVTPVTVTPQGADLMGAFVSNLPAVTLREASAGALEAGTELVVYVVPTMGGVPLINSPLVIVDMLHAPTVTVAGGGTLNIGPGIPRDIETGRGSETIRAFVFRVNTASNAPASITFSGGAINGVLFGGTGVEFDLVIGGNAVATDWSLETASMPYFTTVGVVGQAVVLDPVQTPGPTPQPTPQPTPPPTPAPNLPPQFINVQAGNFVVHTFPAGYNVAMVSVAEMARMLNATYTAIGANAFEISGTTGIGAQKDIRLFLHQTDAMVRGIGTDIAVGSVDRITGANSGSPGSIWPVMIDGVFMVPVRFIANSFGYTNIQGSPAGLFLSR